MIKTYWLSALNDFANWFAQRFMCPQYHVGSIGPDSVWSATAHRLPFIFTDWAALFSIKLLHIRHAWLCREISWWQQESCSHEFFFTIRSHNSETCNSYIMWDNNVKWRKNYNNITTLCSLQKCCFSWPLSVFCACSSFCMGFFIDMHFNIIVV